MYSLGCINSSGSIVFISGQLGLGGAEKQLYLLARGLFRMGWKVSVITLNSDRGDYWEDRLRELGVPLYGIASELPRLHRLLAIRNILNQQRVQIVHSWLIYLNLYAVAGGKLSGTPVRIGSERCNHYSSYESLGRTRYNMSLWGLDSMIANSEAAAAFLRRHRPNLAIKMVPNGVEIPEPLLTEEHKKKLRESLGISKTAFVIGAVGSMVPRKNFATLIKVVNLLLNQQAEILLVLIGDGPLRVDLECQAFSSLPKGQVFFTGAIPNAASWLPAFDLLCLPSWDQEGTPNVLMEASAAELPVIATAVGGVSQIVDDGVTGFLVPLNDTHALVDRLRRFFLDSSLRYRMGQAGREKMRREFNVEVMVNRMAQVYQEALTAKSLASKNRLYWTRSGDK